MHRNGQITAVSSPDPPSAVQHIRVAEKSLSLFQMIEIVIDLIGNFPVHHQGQFHFRMPVPQKRSRLKIRQSFIADQQRKSIISVRLQLFFLLIDL